jgi:hypothetical protein
MQLRAFKFWKKVCLPRILNQARAVLALKEQFTKAALRKGETTTLMILIAKIEARALKTLPVLMQSEVHRERSKISRLRNRGWLD